MEATKKPTPAQDVQAVVTSFNQGTMIEEAVLSLRAQTTPPAGIWIVDDGSSDPASLEVLRRLEKTPDAVPVTVIRQQNQGVSAARNAGIRHAGAPFVLVLDGDDRLAPGYIEQVSALLRQEETMVAASSWMRTFGVLEATVCPTGGNLTAFLPRNACPATHILRRRAWEACGGYDEAMRAGFEDWEFFLHLLETAPEAWIGIVPQPLLAYRTAPASANVQSMTGRLDRMRYIIQKHQESYRQHVTEAVLGLEAISMARMSGWEEEMRQHCAAGQAPGGMSAGFLQSPSYGDGGMAAAVRIVSAAKKTAT